MQALVSALLLALSAVAGPPAEPSTNAAELRRELAIAGLGARQTLTPETRLRDPCGAAREIARQPPCLASDDCEALQLWRRSFGGPRIEPLDPQGAARPRAAGAPGRPRLPPTAMPRPHRTWRPGFYCPAGADPSG